MAQWINLNRNNRSVALIFFIVRKSGPMFLLLVGHMEGWLAGRRNVGGFQKF